ncbi:MAG: hypothetical protein ACJ78Q_12115 [Chloroflexia bacterium]
MFTTEERDRVREWVLEWARSDQRVTGGALTGSMAVGEEDAWSDIDLAFGVVDGVRPGAVLDDWAEVFGRELGTLHYWDLPFGSSIYRVFLLPSGLEVDVSVTPERDFGARGPRFRTLFGKTRQLEPTPQPAARYLVGLGWHHVLHARSSIERGKPWRAAYWIGEIRNEVVALACLRFGESAAHGRGVDSLPGAVTDPLVDTLVRSLDEVELRRALCAATACYVTEVEAWDRELCAQLRQVVQEFGAQ